MASERIPKTIHYCWFSGEPFPRLVQQCVDSWRRVMPDYQLRLWDADSFDFDSIPFVSDAIRLRKWAFAADYVRLYALFTEGGIYLDSDVRVMRPFDPFLQYGFFTSHEIHPYNCTEAEKAKVDSGGTLRDPADHVFWLNIQAAIMGGEKGHPFFKECLSFYEGKRLATDRANFNEFIIGPHISKVAERFGYRYLATKQQLQHDMMIFEPEVFVGNSHFLQPTSYAIHLCNNSWHDRTGHKRLLHKLRNDFPGLSPAIGVWEKVLRNVVRRTGKGHAG